MKSSLPAVDFWEGWEGGRQTPSSRHTRACVAINLHFDPKLPTLPSADGDAPLNERRQTPAFVGDQYWT